MRLITVVFGELELSTRNKETLKTLLPVTPYKIT